MLHKEITNWLSEYLHNNKLNSFVVGVSGGIDSALTSTLCALTGHETILVSMPIHQSKDELKRAENHMAWLKENHKNVTNLKLDLTQLYETFKNTILLSADGQDELGFANSRSRLRMVTLYQIATTHKGIVVGTGNKVEDYGVGFYTKYGDGGVDIAPIADLMKSEVRKISSELNINQEIIDAQPTDGLWDDGRNDEDQIGATYDELEWAMEFNGDVDDCSEREKEVLKIYNYFNNKNKHKMISIPTFRNDH